MAALLDGALKAPRDEVLTVMFGELFFYFFVVVVLVRRGGKKCIELIYAVFFLKKTTTLESGRRITANVLKNA